MARIFVQVQVLFLILLFAAGNALAQGAVAEVVPGEQWWVPVLSSVGLLLGSLFVFLIKTYGGKLITLIVEKSGNPFLGEITERALVTALSFYQTEIRHIKGTARWDQEAKDRLRRNGIAHLQMLLDADKVRAAAGEMGIEDFLGHYLEAAVAELKTIGRAAAPAKSEDPPVDPSQG
jgi:hypothetical protein